MKFSDKLNKAIERNQSLLCVELAAEDPDTTPSQEWLQFLIAETADLVCAYKVTLDFYLSSDGLWRQTLKAIPPDIPVILDAGYCRGNGSKILARTIFQQWGLDGVMLNPYGGQDDVVPFLLYQELGVFILCATANPSAAVLQEYPHNSESPFYLHLVKEAKTWGTPEQLGLVVGGREDVLARTRAIAPERLIIVEDLEVSDDLNKTLEAGLNGNGDGLMVTVPQSKEPGQTAIALREEINKVRDSMGNPACSLWVPDVCLLNANPHKDLILQLYDIGCIHFGEYVQASGATFPYYIDLRTIISHPQVFEQVLGAYAHILSNLNFDRIAGIPYGSLPTATGLGLRLNYPMIFPRKEVKAHGTGRLVEGKFRPGETVVVIDDILISGKSITEGAAKLESVGLKVTDLVVFINHEEGVSERVEKQGYRTHAVLSISEIAQTLYEAGRLNSEQWQVLSKSGG